MASQTRPASRAFMEAFTTGSTWTRGWRWGGRSRAMRVLRTRIRRKTRTTNDGQMDRMGGVSTAHPPSAGRIFFLTDHLASGAPRTYGSPRTRSNTISPRCSKSSASARALKLCHSAFAQASCRSDRLSFSRSTVVLLEEGGVLLTPAFGCVTMWEHPFHQHLFDVRIAAQNLQRFRDEILQGHGVGIVSLGLPPQFGLNVGRCNLDHLYRRLSELKAQALCVRV